MRQLVLISALLSLLTAGCEVGPVMPEDTDGDGLADSYELAVESSPEASDSDGDGWSDYDEIYDFTDPNDEDSTPYIGGWDRLPKPEGLGALTGHEVGDVMDDFLLVDQYDDEVDLHHFYGMVLLIDSSAEW